MKLVVLCIQLVVTSSIKVRYYCFEQHSFDSMDSRDTYVGEDLFSEKLIVYVLSIGYEVRRPLTSVENLRKSLGFVVIVFKSCVCFCDFLVAKKRPLQHRHNELYSNISNNECYIFLSSFWMSNLVLETVSGIV